MNTSFGNQSGEQYSTFMEAMPPKALVAQTATFFEVSEDEATKFLLAERLKIKSQLDHPTTFGKNDEHVA